MAFIKASKKQSKLRMFIGGPSGAGKTFSALRIMRGIVGPTGRIAVIDTERGSASKYADDVESFDVQEIGPDYHPDVYIRAIREAAEAGYDGLIVDSGSHEYAGPGGILEIVDAVTKRNGGNKFTAWAVATPLHQKFIDTILSAPLHVVVTLRAKSDYVIEQNDRGKATPRKIGLAAVQRDGFEFEPDVYALMDLDHTLVIEKTRCAALDGKQYPRPGTELGQLLAAWLSDGAVAPPPPPPVVEPTPTPTPAPAANGSTTAAKTETHTTVLEIGGREYRTAGVGKPTLLALWDACTKLDKLVGAGTAKAVILDSVGKHSSVDCTEPQGKKAIRAVDARFVTETKQRAAAATQAAGDPAVAAATEVFGDGTQVVANGASPEIPA